MSIYTQNGLTWDEAFPKPHWPATDQVAQANAENRGGFNDWRLPTVAELASIIKYGDPDTATPAGIPGMPAAIFMTIDESMHDFDENHQSYYYIGVDFNGGFVAPVQKTTAAYAMLVRGALDTSLIWKLSDGTHSWGTVIDEDGYHVPSPNELLRLPDYSRDPVTPAAYPAMTPNLYWTNAECLFPALYGQAFAVDFSGGRCESDIKTAEFPVMLCKASGVVPVTTYTEAEVRSWYANVNMAADAAMVLYWMDASHGGPDAFYLSVVVDPLVVDPPGVVPGSTQAAASTLNIYSPEISVILKKTTSRDQSGKSERYTVGAKAFDLKPFLTEESSVTFSRQINAPTGSFQITVGDRGVMHDKTLDSLYGIAETMDVIEIRMARSPHEYKGKLPLVFRGVVSEIRRDESMGQDGKPQRTVTLAGHDWGKFLQIIQERYIPGNPLSEVWLSGLVMQVHYGIPYNILPAGDLITQMVQKIGNKFLADYNCPDVIPPFLIDVSGADPDDKVFTQGFQAMPDGTLWDFLKTYGDLGPFYEMFIDDTEAGPKLIYRKPPMFTADGDLIYGTLPDSVNIDPNQVQRLSVSRSDADVANWVWIKMKRLSLLTNRDLVLTSMAQNPEASFMDYANCRRGLYGIRTMTVETNHGFMFQSAPKEQVAIDQANMSSYREKKTRQIRLSNMDNSVFETGSMTIAGNEKVKVGTNVRIQRGKTISLYYAQGVTHTFQPFRSFTTSVNFIRGTGFINRSSNDQLGIKAPYLEEIGHGLYESAKP